VCHDGTGGVTEHSLTLKTSEDSTRNKEDLVGIDQALSYIDSTGLRDRNEGKIKGDCVCSAVILN
jgi:hypothetical protein